MYELSTAPTTTDNQLVSTDISIDRGQKFECDKLFDELGGLVNEQFKSWYCSCFYKLGRDETIKLADKAKKHGKPPQKLFSYMLKKACKWL